MAQAFCVDDCVSEHFPQRVFNDLGPLAVDLALRYQNTAERFSFQKANQELADIHQLLRRGDLNLCDGTEELKETAKRCAEKCKRARRLYKLPEKSYLVCKRIVEGYGLLQPSSESLGYEPALNRMSDWRWWFRKIKTLRLRSFETIARNIELVNRCRSTYASDYTVKLKRQQKEANRKYLESTFVLNELGQGFSLQELADKSVANPANRRAELMIRIKGFEMVAGLLGHVGEFYTLTTPSRMHACLHNGAINPKYDGTTTLQAHEYLTHLWTLIRAELHRQGIRPYGFRVVEPHHDGTPHWHLLLFMPSEQRQIVREIMQRYALAEDGNEPGAKLHRFKAVAIDPSKGTATGYIAKYIAKNIDGFNLEKDLFGNAAAEAAERITTWANTWGIRQFQQIGGPSVTVWRQLRRLGETEDQELENIRQTATASDWAAFVLATGGPDMQRSEQAIKPFYDFSKQLNPNTGEIIFKTQDSYGSEATRQPVGVIWRKTPLDTRKHFWSALNRDSEAKRGDCAAAGAAQRPAADELSTLRTLTTSGVEGVFLDLYH